MAAATVLEDVASCNNASIKMSNVRKASLRVGGNFWKAVKVAKNLITNDLPSDLTLGGEPVASCDVVYSFAKHFYENNVSLKYQ